VLTPPVLLTVTVSPARAALTTGQTLSIKVTTNDPAGVTLETDKGAGTVDRTTAADGATVNFTAGTTAGNYSVRAVSITDPSRSSEVSVAVTDLMGIYTFHNSLMRDGANSQEYALAPSNVTPDSFGKLFSCPVDGAVYAQPLWVANLVIGGLRRNVVFVATAHDSLFAFDADTSPCKPLWMANLIDAGHGGATGETTVPGTAVGRGAGDLMPEVGVTGTPVIDPGRGMLFVVSKSMSAVAMNFYQRLHAIDLRTGAEAPGSPTLVTASVSGTGEGGTVVNFNARTQNQRAGLTLVGATIYVAWGSHEDGPPYYGWLATYIYDGYGLTQTHVLNLAPDKQGAGVWMSGAGPAVDAGGNVYLTTGNGAFDVVGSAPGRDYGDSFVRLTGDLKVRQFFTPSDQQTDSDQNNDFGSGGATVLADLPAGSPVTHVALTGGKDGALYVLNRDALGGYGDSHAWQQIQVGIEGDLEAETPGVIFGVPALWNGFVYLAGASGPLQSYRLDSVSGRFAAAGRSMTPAVGFGYPGATPSVSSLGTTNGIVWAVDSSQYCTKAAPGCGPAVLHAYDASNLGTELWNSSMSAADIAGHAVKFVVPTVANGKVYIGTRADNTGGAMPASGRLEVYGLKRN
jgi:hypothetical protein